MYLILLPVLIIYEIKINQKNKLKEKLNDLINEIFL